MMDFQSPEKRWRTIGISVLWIAFLWPDGMHSTANAQDECFTRNTCESCLEMDSHECEWISYTNCLDGVACTMQSVTEFCRPASNSTMIDPSTYTSSNSTVLTTCERARHDLVCQTAQTGCDDCLATQLIENDEASHCEWRAGVCATNESHELVGRPARVHDECQPCYTYFGDCLGCLNAGCFYNYFYEEGSCDSQELTSAGDYFPPSTRLANEESCEEAARISTCRSMTDCESCTSLQWSNNTRSCTWKIGMFDGQPAQCCTDNCTVNAHFTTKTCSACETHDTCSTCLNAGCRWDGELKCLEECSETSTRRGICDRPPPLTEQINETCARLKDQSCDSKNSCQECTAYSFEQGAQSCGWENWSQRCYPTSNGQPYQEGQLHVLATTCESCEVHQSCEECLASTAGCSWEVSASATYGTCKLASETGVAFRRSTTTPIAETCRVAESTHECVDQTNCGSCLETTTTNGFDCVWHGFQADRGLCCTEECLGVTTQGLAVADTMTTECKFCSESTDCESCLDNDMFTCMWWHDNKCTEEEIFNDIDDPLFLGAVYGSGYLNNSLQCKELEMSLEDIDTCAGLDDCNSCNSANLHFGTCGWYPNAENGGVCCTGWGCCDYPRCEEPLGDRSSFCEQVDCGEFESCEECLGDPPASNTSTKCKWSTSQHCTSECANADNCYEVGDFQDGEAISTICGKATQSAPPSTPPSSPATKAPTLQTPSMDSASPTPGPIGSEVTTPPFNEPPPSLDLAGPSPRPHGSESTSPSFNESPPSLDPVGPTPGPNGSGASIRPSEDVDIPSRTSLTNLHCSLLATLVVALVILFL